MIALDGGAGGTLLDGRPRTAWTSELFPSFGDLGDALFSLPAQESRVPALQPQPWRAPATAREVPCPLRHQRERCPLQTIISQWVRAEVF